MAYKKEKLSLAKALRLSPTPPPRVAFVGAGGKTTALFQLAREIAPCIVTTTTHLGTWQADLANQHIIIRKPEDVNQLERIAFSGIVLVTGEEKNAIVQNLSGTLHLKDALHRESTLETRTATHPKKDTVQFYRHDFEQSQKNNRLTSLPKESLAWLEQFCNYHSLPLLIEADGARQKPLKAPKEDEPVIPDFVDTVVVVAGLSEFGKSLSDKTVYNAKKFTQLGKIKEGEKITPESLTKVLLHEEGGLKNIPARARKIALLTQANIAELEAVSGRVAKNLLSKFDAALTFPLHPSTRSPELVEGFKPTNLQTFEPSSAIILAAGKSSRFGESKQLLDYHGKTFIRTIAENALKAELSSIIVITGTEHEKIKSILQDLPVKIVHNPNWEEGQSSSIRAGVNALPTNTGSAIFLLADQPQVTPTIMRTLVEKHSQTLHPVIAPMVEDKRANPVLFDHVTFPALLKLKGDIGGRGIFSKFSPKYILWLDSALLLDVDDPKDYEKLLKLC